MAGNKPKGAVPQEMIDALNQIDTDLNTTASVVDSLRAKIKTGMSQTDVDQVNGKLTEISTRLKAIAADPDQPVPPNPPPTPV